MSRHLNSARHATVLTLLAVALLCTASARADFQFVYGGHTYLAVTTPRTWSRAAIDATFRDFAGATGALARIDDQAENDAIFAALSANIPSAEFANTDAPDGGGGAYVWIGATDRINEGDWLWDGDGDAVGDAFWSGDENGAAVGGLYNNWGRNPGQTEPDNFQHTLGDQDGAGISLNGWPLGSAGQWNDVNVINQLYYLVEFAAVPEPAAIVLLALGGMLGCKCRGQRRAVKNSSAPT
jgi:hypothetical protein